MINKVLIRDKYTECVIVRESETSPAIYCLFPSKELKNKYIELESRQTKHLYNNWLVAEGESRVIARDKLNKARMSFAKNRGFVPQDKNTWVLKKDSGPKAVA